MEKALERFNSDHALATDTDVAIKIEMKLSVQQGGDVMRGPTL